MPTNVLPTAMGGRAMSLEFAVQMQKRTKLLEQSGIVKGDVELQALKVEAEEALRIFSR